MNNDRDQHTSPPVMCKNNCGFCGSPANENYCSKCYREHLKRKSLLINTTNTTNNSNTIENNIENTLDTTDSTVDTVDTLDKKTLDNTVVTVVTEENKVVEEDKIERDRCNICKKMVGLLGFSCRCGNVFCSLHRQANVHNCQFDYKSYNRIQLEKKSVKVVADKLERI